MLGRKGERRLNKCLGGLKTQPKNMNDALNLTAFRPTPHQFH